MYITMTSEYCCVKCDYECSDMSNWTKHINTSKHLGNKNVPEVSNKLPIVCIPCNYTCYKQSLFDKHSKTSKHLGNIKVPEISNKLPIVCIPCNYTCYKQSLLDKHKMTNKHKLCEHPQSHNTVDYSAIIAQLLNQNSELKNFIIEQANEHKKDTSDIFNKVIEQAAEHKKETVEIVNKVIDQAAEHKKETLEIVNKVIEQTKTINNNTITNNSKAFNINMYLNEQCKDAMNFSDFINGIEVSHEDLENNAQLGFVGGISKILIDNLKMMNKNERPIHCTDAKRETMYIKDDNKWSKEEDDSKLRSAIQEITRKSICSLIGWKRGNPESDDMDSKFSGRCIVIQQQSMAGFNREVYYPKVIHAIAREVLILK
jgi:hypothetical protein